MKPKPKKTIHGYSGPTGLYAVVDGRILPMAGGPGVIAALANSAMLTGLGFSSKAVQFETALAHTHAAA